MKEKKYTILIMSAPIGSGHALAAQALQEEFTSTGKCEVVLGNAFDFFPKVLGTMVLEAYLFVLKKFPVLYEIAYRWGNNPGGSFWLRNLINKSLAVIADSYLRKVSPDLVIATHATPAGIFSAYKERHSESRILLASVITDHTVHKWWLCKNTDFYFLGAELDLGDCFGSGQQIFCHGIPVRKEFNADYDREVLRASYGWSPDETVCILMGGGEGLLPMQDIINELGIGKNEDRSIRCVAITGRNKVLERELQKKYPEMQVYGFTEEIPKLMHAADVLISKAGGLTAAETLTTGLYYIVYRPLPGQEKENAEYLRMAGAAVIAEAPSDVLRLIRSLPSNKEASAGNLGKPEAAKDIVRTLLCALADR